MAHYIYKPHVQGPEFITTPDILVDRLFLAVAGDQGLRLAAASIDRLSSNPELQCADANIQVRPACFLIAAGAGSILSFGAVVLADEAHNILVSRFAWRLKYLNDHLDQLTLAVSTGDGNSGTVSLNELPLPSDIINSLGDGLDDLPRGIMVCNTAPGLERQCKAPANISVSVSDGQSGRNMEHRLSLIDANTDRWEKRPQPRYTTGPQTGDVRHYV